MSPEVQPQNKERLVNPAQMSRDWKGAQEKRQQENTDKWHANMQQWPSEYYHSNVAGRENESQNMTPAKNKTAGDPADQKTPEQKARDVKKAQRKESLKRDAQNFKRMAKSATPAGVLSLSRFVELTDLLVFFAFIIAFLKDILDFVGLGSLPLIGTVITLMVSIVVGVIMLMIGTSSSNRASARRMSRSKLGEAVWNKWGTLFGATVFEFLFGVNFLPIETTAVFIMYWLTLIDRKEAYEAAAEEAQQASYAKKAYAFARRRFA